MILLLLALPHLSIYAEREGVHCSVITDQDGDEVILMESEWISMHLLPRMQAIIHRFVFRPTGNDIVEALHAKIRMMGGGILMDCFWEQDWRFQELKEKPYFQLKEKESTYHPFQSWPKLKAGMRDVFSYSANQEDHHLVVYEKENNMVWMDVGGWLVMT